MPRVRRWLGVAWVPVALVASLVVVGCERESGTQPTPTTAAAAPLQITYPQEGTLFPPEIVAPTFLWADATGGVDRWDVVVRDDAGAEVLREAVDAPRWRPSEERWKQIKARS